MSRGLVVERLNSTCRLVSVRCDSHRASTTPVLPLSPLQASLGAPDAAHPDWGRIEIAAEVSPLCNLQPRSLSEPLAAAVASQLSRSGLEQALDLKALGIVPGRRCWVLYVDVLLLSLDGALASAASVGLKAALAATSVPRLTLVQGEDPEDEPDYELDDDPEAAVHLDVEKVPLVVAVAKIGEGVVVDPTAVEEACAAAVLLAGVLPNGELTGLTKELTGAVGAGDLLVRGMACIRGAARMTRNSIMPGPLLCYAAQYCVFFTAFVQEMFEAASTQGRQMQAALSSFLGASGKVVSQIF